jgi:hypothetical protein
MSSGVETSLESSALKTNNRFLDFARNDRTIKGNL